MARYYEEETLFQSAKDELLKYFSDSFVYTSAELFHKVLANTPTADVVPKSEVDDLKRYIILNEDIAIKCKQENGEQNEEYWKGKISAFRQILAYIDAELKKKYAENENG